jgi:RecB family exonuclease
MENEKTIRTIRASMLSAYNDCPRRAIARQYRSEIEESGYKLNSELPTIGASIGTATHAVIEAFYRSRIEGKPFVNAEAIDAAVSGLEENTKNGCLWDDTTPNAMTAKEQITRMTSVYIESIARDTTPIAVEARVSAEISEKWELSGHVDLVAICSDGSVHLRDIKTGAKMTRSHHAQLGAYSLLLRSDSAAISNEKISKASVDFIKRSPKRRPQEEVISIEYDISLCEIEAWNAIKRIISQFEDFDKTKEETAFPANPMSLMCSEKFCIAHGTEFCKITKAVK